MGSCVKSRKGWPSRARRDPQSQRRGRAPDDPPGSPTSSALMDIRWTEEAANDLERIIDYLLTDAPERATELVQAIYEAPTFPAQTPARAPRQRVPVGRRGDRRSAALPL